MKQVIVYVCIAFLCVFFGQICLKSFKCLSSVLTDNASSWLAGWQDGWKGVRYPLILKSFFEQERQRKRQIKSQTDSSRYRQKERGRDRQDDRQRGRDRVTKPEPDRESSNITLHSLPFPSRQSYIPKLYCTTFSNCNL